MSAFWGFEHMDGRVCRYDESAECWLVEADSARCPRSHFTQDGATWPFGTSSEPDDFYAEGIRQSLFELRAINAQLKCDERRRQRRFGAPPPDHVAQATPSN